MKALCPHSVGATMNLGSQVLEMIFGTPKNGLERGKRLMQEGLYTSTSLMVSPREAVEDGRHRNMSDLTSPKTFVTEFAGHIAAAAAR